jgi:hypothetical protein
LGSTDFLWAVRFEGNSHFASVLEGSPDVIVLGAAVERNKLETVRALHLKAVANPLRPFSKHHRALGALDFDLIVDHGVTLETSRLPSKPCAFTKVGPDYPHIRLPMNRQAHPSVRMIFAKELPQLGLGQSIANRAGLTLRILHCLQGSRFALHGCAQSLFFQPEKADRQLS